MIELKVPEKKFRPELEGVRAVAAFLVAIYHIWIGNVSGGVDVFFIVSGFLITTSLMARIEKEGRIRYFEYILGLGRRLFPLAFLVLFFCTVLSYLLLPQVQWKQVISEVFSSTFYFQNWKLATDAVDYLAQNNEASPLQHFWALSIQGQFYVTWPLVIFLAYFVAIKLLRTPFRKTLLVLLSTLFLTSLLYSIYITAINQPWAYFDTFARVWEFSLGGLLALLIPYLSINKWLSTFIGWIGLLIITLTGILLPVSSVFPGYAALLPTSGVMLIIIAAENHSNYGIKNFLGSKPFKYFGSISYGFYLWHWPLLIFYFSYFKVDTVSISHGIIILLVTFILSIISTKIFEEPVRKLSVRTSSNRLVVVLLIFMVPVLGTNLFWNYHITQLEENRKDNYNVVDYPGARVLWEDIVPSPDIEPITTPLDAESILPTFYMDGCYVKMEESGVKVCSYGDTKNPQYRIALLGGSHSGHWFPALEQFAEELNIQIDVYNKDACRFSTQDFNGLLSETCMEWNELVIEPLLEDPPDIIFTTANVANGSTVPLGYIEMWEKFEGISKIFAIRDNPIMKSDIPSCVQSRGIDECTVPRAEVLSDITPWENTIGIPSNVYFADLSDYFCDADTCYPVIGNVLVYRDNHHISTLYSMTLAEPLKAHIIKALEH